MGKKNKEFQLLVEGKNDQHVIWNLAQKLSLKETFEVIDKNSYNQIISSLPTMLKSTNTLKRLGVIVDADENLEGHWTSIRNILMASGYYSSIPTDLPKEGLICKPDDEEQLIFGLWIMPDNNLNGMLEDFICYHTWLAWQDKPGTAMGTAITKQILSTDGILCNNFVLWLKNLFDC